MIKNRTSQFKHKYSNSQSKASSKRDVTPQYVKNKLALTGFTINTQATTNNIQKKTKKMAKVESTAYLKSRTKLDNPNDQTQLLSKKIIENQTSLCQYLKTKTISIENQFPQRYRKILDESQVSQKTANMSQKTQQLQQKQKLHQVQIKKKTPIHINSLPNIQKFFATLTPRSLFFCCKCFRYVFAIEKNLHYPECQSQIELQSLDVRQKQMLAWEKMNMIVQLSQYTKTKVQQIQGLLQLAKSGKLIDDYDVNISGQITYIGFDDIEKAFFYTYQKLLKQSVVGYISVSGLFSVKKIFSCVEARGFQSGLFERRFFG